MAKKTNRKKTEDANSYRAQIATELQAGSLTYAFGRSGVPGTVTLDATLWCYPSPVATVWYQFVDAHTITIMQSFVPGTFRRLGLRTFLHQKLIATYPEVTRIVSSSGTEEGAAWMRRVGYRQTPEGHWIFRVYKSFRAK